MKILAVFAWNGIRTFFAAPTAFLAHSICTGRKLTSYPSTKEPLDKNYSYVEGQRVVVDGNLITSRVSVVLPIGPQIYST